MISDLLTRDTSSANRSINKRAFHPVNFELMG